MLTVAYGSTVVNIHECTIKGLKSYDSPSLRISIIMCDSPFLEYTYSKQFMVHSVWDLTQKLFILVKNYIM